jgi:hypothetical protein
MKKTGITPWDAIDYEEETELQLMREKQSPAEIRAAAEIVVYLEDLGVDVRRIRVRVREGQVFIQGSVASAELKKEIETHVPRQPQVKALETNLTVVEDL